MSTATAPAKTYNHRSFTATPVTAQAARVWWVVDATDKPLGRLASEVAHVLRGKHKPTYTPNVDMGDFVIVLNAGDVQLTGTKPDKKLYYHHTLFPGGLKTKLAKQVLATEPERAIREAVWGMLPKGPLGRRIIKKLKIYRGAQHEHTAQQPRVLEIKN